MLLKRLLLCLVLTGMVFFPQLALAGSGTVSYAFAYQSQFGSSGNGNVQFDGISQMAFGPDNNLYIADRYNGRVQVLDANGNFIRALSGAPSFQPTGVTFRGTDVIVSYAISSIEVFNGTTGAYQSQLVQGGGAAGQVDSPAAVAHDAAGNIYVANTDNDRVSIYQSNGTLITEFGSFGGGNGQFNSVSGIAVAANGNIYVADLYNNRVHIFDSSYNFVGYLAESGSAAGEVDRPRQIHIDSAGLIYVSDTNNNRVQVFDKNHALIGTYGTNGTGNGQFNSVTGVTVASDGTLYIGDNGNNRVQVVSLVSTETFATSPVGGDETATTLDATLQLTGTGTFNNRFLNYDRLVVNGTNWTLGGNNSFTTSAALNTGALAVNGNLTAPAITVASVATLSGSGTLTGAVVNNGTIAPGAGGFETLNVTGSYTDASSSVFVVRVNDAGSNTRLSITGNAVLNGGVVDVRADTGNYQSDTSYTILSASSGYTGTFASVTSNLAFLVPTLRYSGNDVILDIYNPNAPVAPGPGGGGGGGPSPTQLNFARFAANSNQSKTAQALTAFTDAGLDGDTGLLGAMEIFTIDQAKNFVAQSTPGEIASLPQILSGFIDRITNPLSRRLASLRNFVGQNVWVQGITGVTNQDARQSAGNGGNGYRSSASGLRGGIDREIIPGSRAGISIAYAQGATAFDGDTDRAQTRYTHVDAYGRHMITKQGLFNGMFLEGLAGIGTGTIHTRRFVRAGLVDFATTGDRRAYDLGAMVKAGREIPLQRDFLLIPSLSLAASHQRQDGFTERGAGPLNWRFDAAEITPVTITPMAVLQKTYQNKRRAYALTPSVGAGVSWQLNDRNSQVGADFASAPSSVPKFDITGLRQDPFSLNLQAGIDLQPFAAIQQQGKVGSGKAPLLLVPTMSLTATSRLNPSASEHTANISLNWQW